MQLRLQYSLTEMHVLPSLSMHCVVCRYLVQRVIPMLPRLLCEELCSLHPGYPRFAFSIVWEVDEDGHIYKEWAGRSVISSRAKLAYPMVQQMIEGCFDLAPWGVQLHEGATWEEVRAVQCEKPEAFQTMFSAGSAISIPCWY